MQPGTDIPTGPTRAHEAPPRWRELFIDALWSRGGRVPAAALAVGVSLPTVYRALGEDPAFAGEVEAVQVQLAGKSGGLELRAADGELFQPEELRMRPWLLRFLVVLREEHGNVSAAARAVGVSRQHAYAIRAELPAFASAWDEAVEEATDRVELNAVRLAAEGCEVPIYYRDQLLGTRREHFPTLMLGLLKSRRREVYGPQQLELFSDETGGIRIILPQVPAKPEGARHGAS